MGECGELCVSEHDLSREDLDSHATASIQRARKCSDEGITSWVLYHLIILQLCLQLFDCSFPPNLTSTSIAFVSSVCV